MSDLDSVENYGYEKLENPIESNVSYFEKMEVYKDSNFAENLTVDKTITTNKLHVNGGIITDLSSSNIDISNKLNVLGSIYSENITTNVLNSKTIDVSSIVVSDLSASNIEISNNLINTSGKCQLNDISNINIDISNVLNVGNSAIIKNLSCQVIDISNDKIKIQINDEIIDIDKKIIVNDIINFTEDVSMNKNDIFLRNIFINGNITHNSDEYFSFLRMINILFKKYLNLPDLYSNGSSEKEFNINDEYIKQKEEIKNNTYNFSDNTFLDNIPLENWSGTPLSFQELNDYYDISLNEDNFNDYDEDNEINNIEINDSKTVIKFTEVLIKNNEHYYTEYRDVSFVTIKPDYGSRTESEINNLSREEEENLPKIIDISYVRIPENKPINPGVYFLYDNNNRDTSGNITSQSKNILKNVIKSNYKGRTFYSKKLQLEALDFGILKQELPLNLISSNHNIIFDYNYGYVKVYNEDRKFVDYNDLSENAINNFFTDPSINLIDNITDILLERLKQETENIEIISIESIVSKIKENFKPQPEQEINITDDDLKNYTYPSDKLKTHIFKDLLNYVRQYYYFNYFDKNHLINKRLFKIIDNNELILTFYKYIGRTKTVPNNYKIDGLLPINKSHFNDSSGLKINKTTLFGIDNSFNTLLYNNIAMGYKTVNNDYNSLVVGQFNDGENYRNNLFTVGCGTKDVSENALNIDTSGNQEIRNKVYISLIESNDQDKINAYYKDEFNQKIDASGNNERNYNVVIDPTRVLIQSDVSMNTNLDVSQNVHFGHHDNRMTFDVSQGYVEFGKNTNSNHFRFDIDENYVRFGHKDNENHFNFDISENIVLFGDKLNSNHFIFDGSKNFVRYGRDGSDNNFKFDIKDNYVRLGDENYAHNVTFDIKNKEIIFGKKENREVNKKHFLFNTESGIVDFGSRPDGSYAGKVNTASFDISNGNFMFGSNDNGILHKGVFYEFDIPGKIINLNHDDDNKNNIVFDFSNNHA